MTTTTIPAALQPAFGVTEPTLICVEAGNTLGYYLPNREATDADYDWLMNNVTAAEIDDSLNSGPARPLGNRLEGLHRKYGP